jgi:hypothetical protein
LLQYYITYIQRCRCHTNMLMKLTNLSEVLCFPIEECSVGRIREEGYGIPHWERWSSLGNERYSWVGPWVPLGTSMLIALNRCNQMRFAPVFLLVANFRTIKYDFDVYKGFFMENLTQIRQILKNYFFKFPEFYNKFPVGSQEYRMIL